MTQQYALDSFGATNIEDEIDISGEEGTEGEEKTGKTRLHAQPEGKRLDKTPLEGQTRDYHSRRSVLMRFNHSVNIMR
jgi:hypothetical protein